MAVIAKLRIPHKRKFNLICVGFGVGALYWILESAQDFLLMKDGNLIQQIVTSDPMRFWWKLMAMCSIVLFSLYVKNLIDERRKVQEALEKAHDDLERLVVARTAELSKSNALLQQEVSERERRVRVLELSEKSFHNMEEELKRANDKLRKLDRMKSDFISTVSHELRTPIAVMRQGVSMCLEGDAGELTDSQREFLGITSENIDRLVRLVTDLLDISKIESGKIKLRRSSLDIYEVVKKIKTSFEPEAKTKGVHLNLDIPDEALRFFADEDKMTQIFNNLISNAIRYTEADGRITIGISDGEDFVHCRVADTGCGISRKDIPKLFSKFEQFGRVEGTGYKGTGLGLAIAKGLIERQGGKIWVESELGTGTTFSFTLEKGLPPKILIVDDEPDVVNVIKRFLKGNDYRFLDANTGESAVEIAQSDNPSLVVLDLALPDMNGYQVIERLKMNTKTQNIPVLLLSGYAVDEERLEQIDDRTHFPFIEKPIRSDALCYNIREMLNN